MTTLSTLLLDTVILIAILEVLGQDDGPELPQLVLVCIGVAVANCFWHLLLGWLLGHLIVVPVVVFDGIVLMVFCRLRIRQAAVASALFFVFRVFFGAIIDWMF